jgi:hypothetical protein
MYWICITKEEMTLLILLLTQIEQSRALLEKLKFIEETDK